jgi:co-chaperonin GroES (HSP10)
MLPEKGTILPNKVLVTMPLPEEKKSAGGLILPKTADIITSKGTVVLTGTDVDKLDKPIKVGDEVMFPPRSPQRIHLESGEDYYLLNYQDILLYW